MRMARCDAHYKFTYVDIGHYGKDKDASIFDQSDVYSMLESDYLPIPQPRDLRGTITPYFFSE